MRDLCIKLLVKIDVTTDEMILMFRLSTWIIHSVPVGVVGGLFWDWVVRLL